jgi:hypothetical protein
LLPLPPWPSPPPPLPPLLLPPRFATATAARAASFSAWLLRYSEAYLSSSACQ